ncbi:hypothetical protein BDW72DRAFT_204674 [Aspergillus terricola var. indicus]
MQDNAPHTTARRFTACDVCYRRKIKCDGVRPRCNWCLHQQLDCTYRRPCPRKGIKRTPGSSNSANRGSLIERIRRLDERRTGAGAPSLLPEGLRWIKSHTGIAISLPNSRLDSSLFFLTIQAAYQQREPGPQSSNPSARACVFAFTALVSCLSQIDPGSGVARPPPVLCREYIIQARGFLLAIVQEPFNLMHYKQLFYCTPDVIAKRHLRTLFWLCYTLDKDLALRTGQAHVLKDDDCALDIPPAYAEYLYSCLNHSPGTDSDIRGPIFPVDLRLSMIKARAFTALYSYNGLRKSDAELIRSIREIDEELECWRTSLPPHLRPQLSFMPKHEKPKNTFLILTHMNYYSCVNLIHLASSRCNTWRSPSLDGGALIHGLQSSLTVSVEASRSLLLFLRDSEFRKPDADSVESDMKLLTLAEQTTGRLFLRRNSPMDRVIDLAPINEFTSWLRMHAERAIQGRLPTEGSW